MCLVITIDRQMSQVNVMEIHCSKRVETSVEFHLTLTFSKAGH